MSQKNTSGEKNNTEMGGVGGEDELSLFSDHDKHGRSISERYLSPYTSSASNWLCQRLRHQTQYCVIFFIYLIIIIPAMRIKKDETSLNAPTAPCQVMLREAIIRMFVPCPDVKLEKAHRPPWNSKQRRMYMEQSEIQEENAKSTV